MRQRGARGVDVRHHVDFPDPPPVIVRDLFETRNSADAGVRTKEVNAAEGLDGFCDQGYDIDFIGDVGFDGEASDLIRDFPAASKSISETTTPRDPSDAKRLHIARPMPFAPPVTITTFSCKFMLRSRVMPATAGLEAQFSRR